jgi:hypothetical protein
MVRATATKVEDGVEEVVEFGERTNACLHFDADHQTLSHENEWAKMFG